MAGNKYISNNAGVLTEIVANQASVGANDAGKIVALNSAGVLDSTIVNSKVISAGAGDAGKLPALDGAGRLDMTVMPVGVGFDAATVVTSEALSSGDLVNIWNDAGTGKARKADATTTGKEAHGFVTTTYASGVQATIYFEKTNTAMSGLTPGKQYLSTVAGKTAATAPSGAGNVVQVVGFAVSDTAMNFQSSTAITLA